MTGNVVLRTFSVFLFLSVERCLMQDPVQRHHGMTFAGALQLLLLFFSADGPTKGFYYVNSYKKGRLKGSSSRPAGSY